MSNETSIKQSAREERRDRRGRGIQSEMRANSGQSDTLAPVHSDSEPLMVIAPISYHPTPIFLSPNLCTTLVSRFCYFTIAVYGKKVFFREWNMNHSFCDMHFTILEVGPQAHNLRGHSSDRKWTQSIERSLRSKTSKAKLRPNSDQIGSLEARKNEL